MICQSASLPLPSSVVILPPYFISGVPLNGGHPFRIELRALLHVVSFATYVSVPAARDTLYKAVKSG